MQSVCHQLCDDVLQAAAILPVCPANLLSYGVLQRAGYDLPARDYLRSMHRLHNDLHEALHDLPAASPPGSVYGVSYDV